MLPSTISARLRALTLVLAALLLAGLTQVGVTVVPREGWPHLPGAAVQAHAAGGACGNWFDTPGTVYGPRDYQSGTWTVYDLGVQGYVDVHVDLEDFQYTDPNTGRCYAAYRASAWGPYTDSHGYYVYLRKWICGHQEPSDVTATTPGTGAQRVSSAWDGYSASGGAGISMYISQVSTTGMFYDVSGCGFQADNYWTAADSRNWSAAPHSATGTSWHLNIG